MGELSSVWHSWDRLPDGYDRTLTPLGGGELYWHLYFRGEPVNGGIARSLEDGEEECRRRAWVHEFSVRDRPVLCDEAVLAAERRLVRVLRDEAWDD